MVRPRRGPSQSPLDSPNRQKLGEMSLVMCGGAVCYRDMSAVCPGVLHIFPPDLVYIIHLMRMCAGPLLSPLSYYWRLVWPRPVACFWPQLPHRPNRLSLAAICQSIAGRQRARLGLGPPIPLNSVRRIGRSLALWSPNPRVRRSTRSLAMAPFRSISCWFCPPVRAVRGGSGLRVRLDASLDTPT